MSVMIVAVVCVLLCSVAIGAKVEPDTPDGAVASPANEPPTTANSTAPPLVQVGTWKGVNLAMRVVDDNGVKFQPRAVALLFHGCQHRAFDWFRLPQEMQVIDSLIARQIVPIAISSHGSERGTDGGCWESYSDNNVDEVRVIRTATYLRTNFSMTELPLFGIGVSSGGTFVSYISRHLPFTAIAVIASPGFQSAMELLDDPQYEFPVPPTAWIYMNKDDVWASKEKVMANVDKLVAMGVSSQAWGVEPKKFDEDTVCKQLDKHILKAENCKLLVKTVVDAKAVGEDGFLTASPRTLRLLSTVMQKLPNFKGIFGAIDETLLWTWGRHTMTSEHFDEALSFMIEAAAAKKQ